MSASTDEELTLELALDELEAALADEQPAAWERPRRQLVARAAATKGLRRRTLQLLQAHAIAWIDQTAIVLASRLAAPSWAAYARLRAAQEVAASQAFEADWAHVMRWAMGVPAAELPPPAPIRPPALRWTDERRDGGPGGRSELPWQRAVAALAAHAQPLLRPYQLDLRFAPAHPRTRVSWRPGSGGQPTAHLEITLRDDRDTPRAWFQLLHELGHALAAMICPGVWLPRAVDEAAAAWLSRHLEEPGSFPTLPAHAYDAALHGGERARRHAVAVALAHLEAHPAEARESGEPAGAAAQAQLPWALWHDAGAQPAYLYAETLADKWWAEGLRVDDLTGFARALAYAIAEARALPPPVTAVRP